MQAALNSCVDIVCAAINLDCDRYEKYYLQWTDDRYFHIGRDCIEQAEHSYFEPRNGIGINLFGLVSGSEVLPFLIYSTLYTHVYYPIATMKNLRTCSVRKKLKLRCFQFSSCTGTCVIVDMVGRSIKICNSTRAFILHNTA